MHQGAWLVRAVWHGPAASPGLLSGRQWNGVLGREAGVELKRNLEQYV